MENFGIVQERSSGEYLIPVGQLEDFARDELGCMEGRKHFSLYALDSLGL